MVYLDNAATTFPKPECVYVAMDKMNREGAVNAGRGSYKAAQAASKLIAETKSKIRNLIHVEASIAVVFSPSVTIAMNQIVNGLGLRSKAVVYVSPYEHNAVARSLYELSKKNDLLIKELPLDDNLEIDIERMKYEFAKDKPEAVFCTHVSNVTGYILPVDVIFAEAKKHGSINVLDSAQSLGLIEIRADLLDVDIIGFAGHKTLYGPLGIGGFVNVSGIQLKTFIAGGTGSDSLNLEMPSGNEAKFEMASSNIVAIAGLNAALECLEQKEHLKYEQMITECLISKLETIRGVNLFLPTDLQKHVGIVSFEALFSYELPEDFKLEPGEYFQFLDESFNGNLDELKETFRWSNAYLWLLDTLRNNDGCMYFGELSTALHDAVVSDPKPYRKDIKQMLSNLLRLIEELKMEEIAIDRPNYSQRIQLISM